MSTILSTSTTPAAISASEAGQAVRTDPGVEIPLVDWGSLALRAGRVGPVLPHMAWLLRFPDELTLSLIWPEVHAFCCATKIDFDSTLVGLSERGASDCSTIRR